MMDFHKSMLDCEITSAFSTGVSHSFYSQKQETRKRDPQGFMIDNDYQPRFIPEHCVDRRRWPKGRDTEFQGWSGTVVLDAKKTPIVLFNGGKTYRYGSIMDGCEKHGHWVRKALRGEVLNTPHRWAIPEAQWNLTGPLFEVESPTQEVVAIQE